MNNYKEIITYFKEKAEEYDEVDKQVYWRLSDKLLWEIFSTEVLNNLPENFNFLDAGGGTGRWSIKILSQYINSFGMICDISDEMLEQAKIKTIRNNFEKRLIVEKCDIKKISLETSNVFDLVFNFHNVLGFVENPNEVIKELARVVKKDGFVVSLVPNLYHNLFFNIFVNNFSLVNETIKLGRGRFTENMPTMNLFTPESIKKIYLEAGLDVVLISGFPVTIYPGMQETQLYGSSNHVVNILEKEDIFNKIFDLEKTLYKNIDIASRGNQILILGKK